MSVQDAQRTFQRYLNDVAPVFGHADRVEPFVAYCKGLLLPGDRKSVEPMAARLAPTTVRSKHQSMHHFVATASWDAQHVLNRVAEIVIPVIKSLDRSRRGSSMTRDSEKRRALGRGVASVLRTTRQAGEFSGDCNAFGRQRCRESADRASAVFAGIMGSGSAATRASRSAQGYPLQNQIGACVGASSIRGGEENPAWSCARRCRLR